MATPNKVYIGRVENGEFIPDANGVTKALATTENTFEWKGMMRVYEDGYYVQVSDGETVELPNFNGTYNSPSHTNLNWEARGDSENPAYFWDGTVDLSGFVGTFNPSDQQQTVSFSGDIDTLMNSMVEVQFPSDSGDLSNWRDFNYGMFSEQGLSELVGMGATGRDWHYAEKQNFLDYIPENTYFVSTNSETGAVKIANLTDDSDDVFGMTVRDDFDIDYITDGSGSVIGHSVSSNGNTVALEDAHKLSSSVMKNWSIDSKGYFFSRKLENGQNWKYYSGGDLSGWVYPDPEGTEWFWQEDKGWLWSDHNDTPENYYFSNNMDQWVYASDTPAGETRWQAKNKETDQWSDVTSEQWLTSQSSSGTPLAANPVSPIVQVDKSQSATFRNGFFDILDDFNSDMERLAEQESGGRVFDPDMTSQSIYDEMKVRMDIHKTIMPDEYNDLVASNPLPSDPSTSLIFDGDTNDPTPTDLNADIIPSFVDIDGSRTIESDEQWAAYTQRAEQALEAGEITTAQFDKFLENRSNHGTNPIPEGSTLQSLTEDSYVPSEIVDEAPPPPEPPPPPETTANWDNNEYQYFDFINNKYVGPVVTGQEAKELARQNAVDFRKQKATENPNASLGERTLMSIFDNTIGEKYNPFRALRKFMGAEDSIEAEEAYDAYYNELAELDARKERASSFLGNAFNRGAPILNPLADPLEQVQPFLQRPYIPDPLDPTKMVENPDYDPAMSIFYMDAGPDGKMGTMDDVEKSWSPSWRMPFDFKDLESGVRSRIKGSGQEYLDLFNIKDEDGLSYMDRSNNSKMDRLKELGFTTKNAGPDGIWNTADDGTDDRAGADGILGTDDDVIDLFDEMAEKATTWQYGDEDTFGSRANLDKDFMEGKRYLDAELNKLNLLDSAEKMDRRSKYYDFMAGDFGTAPADARNQAALDLAKVKLQGGTFSPSGELMKSNNTIKDYRDTGPNQFGEFDAGGGISTFMTDPESFVRSLTGKDFNVTNSRPEFLQTNTDGTKSGNQFFKNTEMPSNSTNSGTVLDQTLQNLTSDEESIVNGEDSTFLQNTKTNSSAGPQMKARRADGGIVYDIFDSGGQLVHQSSSTADARNWIRDNYPAPQ